MRSSLNGKIKGLVSYGKYGRASSYPGQRSKRRQKVRTQGHAGQLEMDGRWYLTYHPSMKKSRVLAERKKKRGKDFKKMNWRRKHTHTHTHILHARMDLTKVCTKMHSYRSFLYYLLCEITIGV